MDGLEMSQTEAQMVGSDMPKVIGVPVVCDRGHQYISNAIGPWCGDHGDDGRQPSWTLSNVWCHRPHH